MPRARTVGRRIGQLVREGFPDGHGQAGAIAYRELREGKVRRNPALVKVKPIGSNMTEVEHGNVCVLYSYETPVAVDHKTLGFFRTEEFHSNTTSKHISKWLDGATAKKIPQRDIARIAELGDIDEGNVTRTNPREGPGKFEGETPLARELYDAALEGGADDELGDSEWFGYYWLFTGFIAKDGYTTHGILEEDSQGFITYHEMKTRQAANRQWNIMAKRWERLSQEENG